MTTEKWPLGRAEGSTGLWGWTAERLHRGNADFEATSLTSGLEEPILPRATRIREVTV